MWAIKDWGSALRAGELGAEGHPSSFGYRVARIGDQVMWTNKPREVVQLACALCRHVAYPAGA
jgi:hypothetical protein